MSSPRVSHKLVGELMFPCIFILYWNHVLFKPICELRVCVNELTACKSKKLVGELMFPCIFILYWNHVLFKPICEWQDCLDNDDVDDDINHNHNMSNNNNTIKI